MKEMIKNKYVQYSIFLALALINLLLIITILPIISSHPFWSGFISILSIFGVGFFLAYIFNFAVEQIQKHIKKRSLAVLIFLLIVFSIIIITAVLIIPRIADTIPQLYKQFLILVDWFSNTDFVKQNNINISVNDLGISNAQQIIQLIWSSLSTFVSIFLVMILFLFEFPRIKEGIFRLLPKHIYTKYSQSFYELDGRMAKFTRDYGSLLLVLFIEHLIVTFLLGLNPLIAVSVVVFYLIPIVGGFLYLSSVFLLAFSQTNPHILFFISIDSPLTYALIVFAILFVVFIFDSMFLMPKYIGDALKLSFIIVIFVTFVMSLLNWIGFMLSPFVLVLLKFIFDQYMNSRPKIYDHEKDETVGQVDINDLKKRMKHDML